MRDARDARDLRSGLKVLGFNGNHREHCRKCKVQILKQLHTVALKPETQTSPTDIGGSLVRS